MTTQQFEKRLLEFFEKAEWRAETWGNSKFVSAGLWHKNNHRKRTRFLVGHGEFFIAVSNKYEQFFSSVKEIDTSEIKLKQVSYKKFLDF